MQWIYITERGGGGRNTRWGKKIKGGKWNKKKEKRREITLKNGGKALKWTFFGYELKKSTLRKNGSLRWEGLSKITTGVLYTPAPTVNSERHLTWVSSLMSSFISLSCFSSRLCILQNFFSADCPSVERYWKWPASLNWSQLWNYVKCVSISRIRLINFRIDTSKTDNCSW